MDVTATLQAAEALLAPWAKGAARPDAMRMDVDIEPQALVPAVAALIDAGWGYLAAITGLDPGIETGQLEVLYHFCEGPAIVTLRARIPRDDSAIDSVCGLLPGASFYERELSEMFGITVVGTPNPDRMFLPDDWPDGVYPLRREFKPEMLAK
jgi:Ni,Fe-hydrogenase III component G